MVLREDLDESVAEEIHVHVELSVLRSTQGLRGMEIVTFLLYMLVKGFVRYEHTMDPEIALITGYGTPIAYICLREKQLTTALGGLATLYM